MDPPEASGRSASYGAPGKNHASEDLVPRIPTPQDPPGWPWPADENTVPSFGDTRQGRRDSSFGVGGADAALGKPLSPTNVLYRAMRFRSNAPGPPPTDRVPSDSNQPSSIRDDRGRLPSYAKKPSETVDARLPDGPRSVSASHSPVFALSKPRTISLRTDDVRGHFVPGWGRPRDPDGPYVELYNLPRRPSAQLASARRGRQNASTPNLRSEAAASQGASPPPVPPLPSMVRSEMRAPSTGQDCGKPRASTLTRETVTRDIDDSRDEVVQSTNLLSLTPSTRLSPLSGSTVWSKYFESCPDGPVLADGPPSRPTQSPDTESPCPGLEGLPQPSELPETQPEGPHASLTRAVSSVRSSLGHDNGPVSSTAAYEDIEGQASVRRPSAQPDSQTRIAEPKASGPSSPASDLGNNSGVRGDPYFTDLVIQRLEDAAEKQSLGYIDDSPLLGECAQAPLTSSSRMTSDGSVGTRSQANGARQPSSYPKVKTQDVSPDNIQSLSSATAGTVAGTSVPETGLRAERDLSKRRTPSPVEPETRADALKQPQDITVANSGPANTDTRANPPGPGKNFFLAPPRNPNLDARNPMGDGLEGEKEDWPLRRFRLCNDERGISGGVHGLIEETGIVPPVGGTWPRTREQTRTGGDIRVVFAPPARYPSGLSREHVDPGSTNPGDPSRLANNTPTPRDVASCFSDSSSERTAPGLKTRLSSLRLRISESNQRKKRAHAAKGSRHSRDSTGSTSAAEGEPLSATKSHSAHARGLRQRFSDWMAAARLAVGGKGRRGKASLTANF